MDFNSLNIIRDSDPLMESYLPELLTARLKHLRELTECLMPYQKYAKPLFTWVHGPPGSGKSSVVKKALGELEEMGIKTALVNCWTSQTFYSVLESIFQELRTLVAEKRQISFKYERLIRLARKDPLVIVLDEVDQMYLKERNATLYNLSMLEQAGIVCLSQTREAYMKLDKRVRSRIQPRFIKFKPYSTSELSSILQERAEQCLEPDTWCANDIERIATRSEGDARVAIQTLRIASYLAEKNRKANIELDDIEKGLNKNNGLRRKYIIRSLSEHHRILYQIVKESKEISTADLWKEYLTKIRNLRMEPMARRTFNNYKSALIRNKILVEMQGKGRSNKKMLRTFDNLQLNLQK